MKYSERLIQKYLRYFPVKEGKRVVYDKFCKDNKLESQPFSTKDGFRMMLDVENYASNKIFWYGKYNEDDEVQLIRGLLRAGDCFVDVGANLGYFSLAAAVMVGPRGKVYSFEPNPFTYKLLAENISLNNFKQIEPRGEAVSTECGESLFYFKEGTADLTASLKQFSSHNNSLKVKLISLDSFVAEKGIRPTVIKVDAEECDDQVLLGANGVLASDTPPALLTETLDGNSDGFKLLAALGYESYYLTKHKWKKCSDYGLHRSNNHLWIREDSSEEYLSRVERLVKC